MRSADPALRVDMPSTISATYKYYDKMTRKRLRNAPFVDHKILVSRGFYIRTTSSAYQPRSAQLSIA